MKVKVQVMTGSFNFFNDIVDIWWIKFGMNYREMKDRELR